MGAEDIREVRLTKHVQCCAHDELIPEGPALIDDKRSNYIHNNPKCLKNYPASHGLGTDIKFRPCKNYLY